MTDKLDLAEEIAVLRRALAGQSVMLKQTMMNLEALDGWGKEANRRIVKLEESTAQPHMRLESLEQWRHEAYNCIVELRKLAHEHVTEPTADRYQPANDNNPGGDAPVARAQKAQLIAAIEDLINSLSKEGILSGDMWGFIRGIEAILGHYRG